MLVRMWLLMQDRLNIGILSNKILAILQDCFKACLERSGTVEASGEMWVNTGCYIKDTCGDQFSGIPGMWMDTESRAAGIRTAWCRESG